MKMKFLSVPTRLPKYNAKAFLTTHTPHRKHKIKIIDNPMNMHITNQNASHVQPCKVTFDVIYGAFMYGHVRLT